MKFQFAIYSFFLIFLLNSCKNQSKTTGDSTVMQAEAYPEVIVDQGYTNFKNKVLVTIKYMEIEDDILTLAISYSGGCAEHEFELISNGAYAKSYPPQLTLFLRHDDKEDRCRSIVDKKLNFNLKPVQYPGTGQVVLKFNNTKEYIHYNY